ncbi:hypothetical protein [Streptomyces sp. NPDC057617]|uniref:hypothetical protein n=1 Tax=Streptomyces sp. NPDC057617 TaxID=3346184 RepID=UPI0036A93C2B
MGLIDHGQAGMSMRPRRGRGHNEVKALSERLSAAEGLLTSVLAEKAEGDADPETDHKPGREKR